MKVKGILFFGIGLVAFYLYRIYLTSTRLTYSIGRIKDFSLKSGVISWKQGLVVINPTPVAVPLNSADVDVFLNNNFIGNALLADSYTILPQQRTEILLLTQVSYFDLINIIGGVQNIWKTKTIRVGFRGNINAVNIRVPLNESFDMDFSKVLNINNSTAV